MDLEVFTAELENKIDYMVHYNEKRIIVNKDDFYQKQLYSIGKCIGHFLMHNDNTKYIHFRDTYLNKIMIISIMK